jgi:excisionase family DNA binding protein
VSMAAQTPRLPSVSLPPSDGQVSSASRLLTADELAARWSVGKSQVWRLARESRVPTVHIGRYVRFRLVDLEAWERNGGSGVDRRSEAYKAGDRLVNNTAP